jgi:hypothetical protein
LERNEDKIKRIILRGNSVLQTFITPLLKKSYWGSLSGLSLGENEREIFHRVLYRSLTKKFPSNELWKMVITQSKSRRPDECRSGKVEFENNLKKFKKRLDKEFVF